ncbi:hypothetical protein G4B88_001844 [Cannabis sativa]|uniref:Agenet domain-containing protein n=1 Tax=Cannabis sativa TaxID=3483 RepID=A0A7J6I4R8_CANSA|nr:hypothetical protein G4B88_001844 [Cannabis sativa]
MAASNMKVGDRVEVYQPGHASTGPYFPATVIRSPAKMKGNVILYYVEYGIRSSSPDHDHPLRETVNADNVRPAPPLLPAEQRVLKTGDDVEFFFRNRWFRGVVESMNEWSMYTVRMHDSTRQMVCRHHNLRLHREWNNIGRGWNPPLPNKYFHLLPSTTPFPLLTASVTNEINY